MVYFPLHLMSYTFLARTLCGEDPRSLSRLTPPLAKGTDKMLGVMSEAVPKGGGCLLALA